ncbi:unnamed protein product [Enterobius vermicularis]|uniref:TIL domain-containing protein n=1 Tax=Enterobius vermicularis TaxID=51028 RepID=A0A3P6HK78_ENTVE|nr:unnamed protein product [Enterobius vermicularis]
MFLLLFIETVLLTPISKTVKHLQAKPVLPHSPADPRCNENEVYTTCRTCEATCEDLTPDCSLVCESVGCECQHSKGFVRHMGHCVPMEICDKLNITEAVVPGCESVTCKALEVCKMKEVACLTKECFPKPECVSILDVLEFCVEVIGTYFKTVI